MNKNKRIIVKGDYNLITKNNMLLVLNTQVGMIEESIMKTPINKEKKQIFTLTYKEGFAFRCTMNNNTNILTIVIEESK